MRVFLLAASIVLAMLPVADATIPAAPTNLVGVLDLSNASVELSWTPPDAAPHTYRIYRGPIHLADASSPSYKDTEQRMPGIDAYTVTIVDGDQESAPLVLAVPTVAVCAPTPFLGRSALMYATPVKLCAVNRCIPFVVVGDIGTLPVVHNTAPTCLFPCEPILIGVIPPDVSIQEECIPDPPTGTATTYTFKVVQ